MVLFSWICFNCPRSGNTRSVSEVGYKKKNVPATRSMSDDITPFCYLQRKRI